MSRRRGQNFFAFDKFVVMRSVEVGLFVVGEPIVAAFKDCASSRFYEKKRAEGTSRSSSKENFALTATKNFRRRLEHRRQSSVAAFVSVYGICAFVAVKFVVDIRSAQVVVSVTVDLKAVIDDCGEVTAH
ncbi:MAG: hypothetical protein IJ774_00135 [Selenomonadaceae bacterium]|nr:hypothetical protein [Selenomonadaceae bacterium]